MPTPTKNCRGQVRDGFAWEIWNIPLLNRKRLVLRNSESDHLKLRICTIEINMSDHA